MGSCSGVEFSTWVKIGDDVTIDYHVFDDGLVELHIGGQDGFDLAATEGGLRNLVERIQEALREVQSAAARNDEDCPTA